MEKFWIAMSAVVFLSGGAFGQVVTGGATATSLNVQTLTTGNVLQVTPAVSPDRRYVGMGIRVDFSTLDGIDTFVVSNSSGGVGGGMGAGAILGLPPAPQNPVLARVPFRPAQVGNVVFVDNDKTLLAAQVTAAKWNDTALKDAFRKLADASRQNIVPGIRGMQQAGIDVNARHDFSIPAGTVKDALLAILKTGIPDADMVISAEDKVIQVSTRGQADLVLVVKTYYLEDLLANLPRMVKAGTNLNEIGHQASDGFVDADKPLDLSKAPAPPTAPVQAKVPVRSTGAATNILQVITDTVRPEVWKNHGGKSQMSMVGNRVTIKAPASVHAILDGPKVFNPNKVPLYLQYSQ